MDRRDILKGGLFFAAAASALSSQAKPINSTATVDDFLAKALPSERVRYHSNALMEAMAEMHPTREGWRAEVDYDAGFALIVPKPKTRRATT